MVEGFRKEGGGGKWLLNVKLQPTLGRMQKIKEL